MPEELQDRIKSIANLPTLPHIASRLMRTVNSPNASSASIALLVAQDVSLSAKVLRLANSAFYGVPKSINTLNNAVVILGFKVIQTMVLSLTVFDLFSGGGPLFDRNAFWRHSLRCAVVSRRLALKRRMEFMLDPEEAFCAGLLHDIGKIVMEQYLNVDFHKALHHANIHGISGFEAEKKVLGYTHCDVASWLTDAWSLPDRIRQPLMYHHEPKKAERYVDSVLTCHIADIIGNASGDEPALGGLIAELEQKAAALGLAQSDLAEIIREIPEEMEKASAFIGGGNI